jgi:ATP-dependent Clp protease ATP-binding subunit ClpX
MKWGYSMKEQCIFCKKYISQKKNGDMAGHYLFGQYFTCENCFFTYCRTNNMEVGKNGFTEEIIVDLMTTSYEEDNSLDCDDGECECENCGNVQDNQELVPTKEASHSKTLFTPREITSLFDRFVIGQENAKKAVAVAVYNHYLRINNRSVTDIPKNNIFMIGSTGTGKTYLWEIVAKMLDVPLLITNAGNFTASGYKGTNAEEALGDLITLANFDIEKAQNAIIVLDEVDKLTKNSDSNSDMNSTRVQQCLLKIAEGTIVSVDLDRKRYTLDTKNILFVANGSFNGLKEVINKRVNSSNIGLGFGKVSSKNLEISSDILHRAKSDDLISFGFIPEFVGRFPIITALNDLTQEDLIRILSEPNNCLVQQYIQLFEHSGISIRFDQQVLEIIAKKAVQEKIGARGLKTYMNKALEELLYELPSMGFTEYIITKDVIKSLED